MPSKYDDVVSRLSPEPQNREHQARVELRARELLTVGVSVHAPAKFKIEPTRDTPGTLSATYEELRERKEELEESLKDVNLALTAVVQMLHRRCDEEGIYSIGLVSGGGIDVYREPTAQVTDREAFRKWTISNGLETSLAVNPQTREGIVRHRLLEGLPEPAGVRAFWRPKVRLRRG